MNCDELVGLMVEVLIVGGLEEPNIEELKEKSVSSEIDFSKGESVLNYLETF